MPTILINNGRVFDGTQNPSKVANILIRNGVIETISTDPVEGAFDKVIDASGKWITPGFIDNHTHYDGELLVRPELGESVRHGITTVLLGGCSLSFIYSNVEDCCDMFTRVEAFPRDLLIPLLKEQKNWSSPSEWIRHIEGLAIGPNIASFIGHSDIRTAVMGFDRSLDDQDRPTPEEIIRMQQMLTECLDEGFLGVSMQHNPWDKIDGDRHWSKMLPAAYARLKERNALTKVVRKRGAHLQGIPNLVNRFNVFWYMIQSSAFFWRRKLKTSVVAMMNLKGDPYIRSLISGLSGFFNKVFRADFRLQAFVVPFRTMVQGMDLVIFEEFPTGALARHLSKDLYQRNQTLKDAGYRKRFKKHYANKLAPKIWQKDFGDAYVTASPDRSMIGKSFVEIAHERKQHPVDAFLDLVVDMDKEIEWETTVGNHDPTQYKKLYNDPNGIVGFADSGAHINNLAFYNFPIRMLKYVKDSHERGEPFMSYEKAIWRLTKENADFFNIDAGHLAEGKRADLNIIDFEALDDTVHEYHLAPFLGDVQRYVNRSGEAIHTVIINGKVAWEDGGFSETFGTERFGKFLKGKHDY